jgi:hypothetical protein
MVRFENIAPGAYVINVAVPINDQYVQEGKELTLKPREHAKQTVVLAPKNQ